MPEPEVTPETSVPEPFAYIGRAACGCIRMATVDRPERAREVAREIGKAVRAGETVERVTCEFLRATTWTAPGCTKHEGPLAQDIRVKKATKKQGGLL